MWPCWWVRDSELHAGTGNIVSSPHTSYDTEGTAVNGKVRRHSAAADKNRERQSKVILSSLSLLPRNPQNPTMIGINPQWLWFLCSFDKLEFMSNL